MKKKGEFLKDCVLIESCDLREQMFSKLSYALGKNLPVLCSISSGEVKEMNLFLEINSYIKSNSILLYIYNDITMAKMACADGVIFDEIPEELGEIEKFLGINTEIIIVDGSFIAEVRDKIYPEENSKKIEKPWGDEFSLIGKLLELSEVNSSFYVNPGEDDCSFLKSIEKPVITTDTQKEDVHFRRGWQSPFEIGKKAVSVTLSDLAASFAEPVALFINLSLPETLSEAYIIELYKGVNDSLKRYKCALGGGNISKGREFSIDLFAVGNLLSNIYPKRGNALPGDLICSTGPLGEAKAGLELLLKGGEENNLTGRFKNPVARFDAAKILMENGVKCATDISDGLCGDAMHIAKASDFSISFNIDWIDVSEDLLSYCGGSRDKALEYVFSGGEDYDLLFTCSVDSFKNISRELKSVNKLGEIVEKKSESLLNLPAGISSFNHGKL